MNNNYFIGMLNNCETARIKAFRGQDFLISERIPDAFGLLFPDIIKILQDNIDFICPSDQGMVLFGLQPAGTMHISNEPLRLGRLVEGYRPDYHFCCTLEYLLAPISKLDQSTVWDETHSVIVDFTTGKIMDSDCYVSQVLAQPEAGRLLGTIDESILAIAWKIVSIKQKNYSQAKRSYWGINESAAQNYTLNRPFANL